MGKTIYDYDAAVTIDGSTNWLLIQPGTNSVNYNRINRNTLLGVSGQPADIDTIQTFSNKVHDNTNTFTIKDTLLTLQDNLDTTKQAVFQLSGITTSTTRTYTFPDRSSTLATLGGAQTFTGVITLTSPIISGGTIDNSTITVDSIGEHTLNNGVTIDGLNIMNGALNTNNSVVTSNITDAAVTPAKLLAGTGTGWSWTSWSPTWTNLTVGNGTVTAKYIQTGKTVTALIGFVFGSTSSISGSVSFTLPITSVSYSSFADMALGFCRMAQPGTQNVTGSFNWSSTTSGEIFYFNASSTALKDVSINSTSPFTWTTGNYFSGIFIYEAA